MRPPMYRPLYMRALNEGDLELPPMMPAVPIPNLSWYASFLVSKGTSFIVYKEAGSNDDFSIAGSNKPLATSSSTRRS